MLSDLKNKIAPNIVIAVGVILVVLTAIILVGIDIKSTANGVLATKNEMSVRQKQLDDLVRLRKDSSNAASKLVILQNALPLKDSLFSLPAQIDRLGDNKNVLVQLSFTNETDKSIGVKIIAEGSYDNIVKFIQALERDMVFMNVLGADIIHSGSGSYRAGIQGAVFFKNE